MKIFVLIVSKFFPREHKRAGELTDFHFKIETLTKKHTIRGNYSYWKTRIDAVNRGEAILSLREWNGIPYNSTQRELLQFGKDSGIGVQVLSDFGKITAVVCENMDSEKGSIERLADIAANDGLSEADFKEWFKHKPKEPMAVIHFTEFRY